MQSEFEIRSSDSTYNMSAWCTEKALNVVEALARLVDAQKSNKTASPEIVSNNLYAALWDATKLLSFSCGAKWSPSDRDVIFEDGIDGLEKVKIRYGLPSSVLSRIESTKTLIVLSSELLVSERSVNRTSLHELLDKYGHLTHPILESVRDKLEKVTMGEMEWQTFTTLALEELKELNAVVANVENSLKMTAPSQADIECL